MFAVCLLNQICQKQKKKTRKKEILSILSKVRLLTSAHHYFYIAEIRRGTLHLWSAFMIYPEWVQILYIGKCVTHLNRTMTVSFQVHYFASSCQHLQSLSDNNLVIRSCSSWCSHDFGWFFTMVTAHISIIQPRLSTPAFIFCYSPG